MLGDGENLHIIWYRRGCMVVVVGAVVGGPGGPLADLVVVVDVPRYRRRDGGHGQGART